MLLNLNLMLALTLVWPMDRGSWTKLWPDLLPGGNEPVTAYLRDSIIVVLPQPLAPTMMVRGKQKAMTCSSSLGENERTPLMDSLAMDAMTQENDQ